MPRPTIDQVRGLPDYQPVYRWNLTFASFPAAVANAPTSDDLNLRCETMELPKSTNQAIQVNIRGHQVMQPGIQEYQKTLSVTFTETVDAKIKAFFRAWRESMWQTKTGIWTGQKADLQCTVLMTLLNNQDVGVYQYKLNSTWFEDLDPGQLSSDSDIQRISATLVYDYFEETQL